MKFRKTLSSAIALALSVAFIAGCSGTASSTPSPAPVATAPVATDAAATPEVPAETPAPEAAALNIHWHSGNKYTLNDASGKLLGVFRLAGEATNITVTSVANPAGLKSAEEFQMQASEKFPADIYGGNSLRGAIYSYAEQGAFLPLNDLIDKYAPNIKAYYEANPDVKKMMTAPDGNMYMMSYIPDGDVGRAYFIRTDWLEALKLQVPTTLEELEAVLVAFRDQDPNGNGLKDEIPCFNDKWEEAIRLANLWGARVYSNDTFSERVVLNADGTFYHAWTADAFKEGLKGMAKWYKEGLIDQETFTRKQNSARGTLLTKENRGGMTHEWCASTASYNYNEELLGAVPNFKFEAFLPVSGPQGAGFEEHRRADAKPDGWAISASSKNPEAAIRYMDWFYSEEGNRAINYGVEGESYTMVNGKPQFTDEIIKQGSVNSYLYENYGAQLPIGYAQDYAYEEQWTVKEGVDAYNLYANSNVYDNITITPTMTYTADEIAIQDEVLSPLHTYMDERVQDFITGKADVDAEWDNYIKKCQELGSDKLVGIYESAYARYLAAK